MDFIIGFTVLLIFQIIGEILVIVFQLPVSGPVAGMILLFIGLLIRGRVDTHISAAVTPILSHLSLLFVPAGVGIMLHYQLLVNEWLAIIVTLILTTILMLFSTGFIMNVCSTRLKRDK